MVYKIISEKKNQVGNYIDVNGDGIPEGVIFIDLAFGGEGHFSCKKVGKFSVAAEKHLDKFKGYVEIGTYEDPLNGKVKSYNLS